MGVEEYVEELVPAFPLFTTNVCGLLRRLYEAGKRIEQVEPYLTTLERIYGLLDDEGVPAETVRRLPEVSEVYSAESRATGALMNFYRKMGGGDFGAAVTACREFAHADAARLRLRARLRAEVIAGGVEAGEYGGKIYVEAGYIHLALFVFLRRSLAEAGLNVRVRPRYLLADALSELAGAKAPRQLFVPGDVLTVRAVLKAPTSKEGEELLAARAIIYTALLSKREKAPTRRVRYPHLAEELQLLAYVRGLDFAACEKGFHHYLRKYTM